MSNRDNCLTLGGELRGYKVDETGEKNKKNSNGDPMKSLSETTDEN
jgi:hypothetical protein